MPTQIRFLIIAIAALSLVSCSQKKEGFTLPGYYIRYETKKFDDPAVLAEVQGDKYLDSQILDKSSVIKDLEEQRNEALVALAYKELLLKSTDKPKGVMEVNRPAPKHPLAVVLNRVGIEPVPGVQVTYKESDDKNLIAKFGGSQVTHDDIKASHLVLASIDQRRTYEIANQLNSQLTRILISKEASNAKVSFEDFVSKNLGSETNVAPGEVEAYASSIGLAKSELTEELKGRFADGLKDRKRQSAMEKYVAQKILTKPIAVAFPEPKEQVKFESPVIAGYADAPVSLYVIGSPTCPDCVQLTEQLQKTASNYDGFLQIRWIYNYAPMDGVAQLLSKGGLCITAQNPKLALSFLSDLGKKGSLITEDEIYGWVKQKGAKEEDFKTCLLGDSQNETLKKNLEYAHTVGVTANPTLLVEGYLFEGMVSPEKVDTLLKEKVAQSGETQVNAWIRKLKSYF